jgi:hypothetical protein
MKRTVPLWITALGGFVLIVAFFIPATEGWGEVAAIWFDILAAIAFILGGGNLLKVHLKNVSDQTAGWGYSIITLISFLAMLCAGLFKIGSPPAVKQEYFGERFAPLALSDFPESQIASLPGKIPSRADGEKLPPAVRNQISEENGNIVFRGWMLPSQKKDLIDYQDELEWQCAIEKLFKESQPKAPLKRKIAYYADHKVLSFKGYMTDEHKTALLAFSNENAWKQAVDSLYEQSSKVTPISLNQLPKGISIPDLLKDVVEHDGTNLQIKGPMSTSQRDDLANQFLLSKPLRGERRIAFRKQLESLGESLTEAQETVFNKYLDGAWTIALLRKIIDDAGKAQEVDKSACEMLEEIKAGVLDIKPKKKVGEDVPLNIEQLQLLKPFANDDTMSIDQLVAGLKTAGPLKDEQIEALKGFNSQNPTFGKRNKALCFALLKVGSLNDQQRDSLLKDYRTQLAWRKKVGELFIAAHVPKYDWSGSYREQGHPFWWLYEFVFKPLTATMFAMLAFYVASAAFRAFRAKNIEAILLLGTAFIILLGRTFAGVWLTSWLPESLSGLRIENLTVTIMQVFNTAGNRAIMIGIALGIASTSLKVLLGVDRSYLGSSED